MDFPEFIMLVGLPGSGKSTLAKSIAEANSFTIISTDSIRKDLCGDESCQDANQDVFRIAKDMIKDSLWNGKSVVFDATNLTRKARANILEACPTGITKSAFVVWNPIEKCIENDKNRSRTVGEEVIMGMAKKFQFPFYDEGFDHINVVPNTTDWDVSEYREFLSNKMKIDQDNSHHTKQVIDHCLTAADYSLSQDYSDDVFLAAKWHDCGKPYVKSFLDSKGNKTENAHYYGHQGVSAWQACGLSLSNTTLWLISTHMDPHLNTKYYRRLPKYLADPLNQLHACDIFSR